MLDNVHDPALLRARVTPDGVTRVAGDAAGNVYCLRYQEPVADAGKQPT